MTLKRLINYAYLYISLFVFFICGSHNSMGQNNSCGTDDYKSPELIEFQTSKERWASPRTDETIYVKTVCHLVGNDDGRNRTNIDVFFQQACETNAVYALYGIQFYIDSISFINNTEYNNHSSTSIGAAMMREHSVDGAMNLFFVQNPAGYCGYYSRGPDALVVGNNCMRSGAYTWAHELGHMFSLPHTFVGWSEQYDPSSSTPRYTNGYETELVDGSNCAYAGDGFCDTPPDYLNYRWPCDQDSMSILRLKDADDVPFHVDGRYIMSYSQAGCRGIFSQEQAEAMKYNIIETRSLDVSVPEMPEILDFTIRNISPALDEEIYFDNVAFSWDPIEGADLYMLEYTALPNFNSFTTTVFLSEPYYVPDTIYPNWTEIKWRVKPYGYRTNCSPDEMEIFNFRTKITSSPALSISKNIKLYPNPVSSGESISLGNIPETQETVLIHIYDNIGRLQAIQQVNNHQGQAILNTEMLSPGLHHIHIQSETFKSNLKLMIISQ